MTKKKLLALALAFVFVVVGLPMLFLGATSPSDDFELTFGGTAPGVPRTTPFIQGEVERIFIDGVSVPIDSITWTVPAAYQDLIEVDDNGNVRVLPTANLTEVETVTVNAEINYFPDYIFFENFDGGDTIFTHNTRNMNITDTNLENTGGVFAGFQASRTGRYGVSYSIHGVTHPALTTAAQRAAIPNVGFTQGTDIDITFWMFDPMNDAAITGGGNLIFANAIGNTGPQGPVGDTPTGAYVITPFFDMTIGIGRPMTPATHNSMLNTDYFAVRYRVNNSTTLNDGSVTIEGGTFAIVDSELVYNPAGVLGPNDWGPMSNAERQLGWNQIQYRVRPTATYVYINGVHVATNTNIVEANALALAFNWVNQANVQNLLAGRAFMDDISVVAAGEVTQTVNLSTTFEIAPADQGVLDLDGGTFEFEIDGYEIEITFDDDGVITAFYIDGEELEEAIDVNFFALLYAMFGDEIFGDMPNPLTPAEITEGEELLEEFLGAIGLDDTAVFDDFEISANGNSISFTIDGEEVVMERYEEYVPTPPITVTPAAQTWINRTGNLTVTVNRDVADFTSLQVGTTTVPATGFSTADVDGSTAITIYAAYLATLTPGPNTSFTATFGTGTDAETAAFTITIPTPATNGGPDECECDCDDCDVDCDVYCEDCECGKEDDPPITGDNSMIWLWYIVSGASVVGIVATATTLTLTKAKAKSE